MQLILKGFCDYIKDKWMQNSDGLNNLRTVPPFEDLFVIYSFKDIFMAGNSN